MKILFVAMAESVHTQRWIKQVDNLGWKIYLFPSFDSGYSHQDLSNITIFHTFFGRSGLRSKNMRKIGLFVVSDLLAAILRKIVNVLVPNYQEIYLKIVIALLKPDIIHSMETQQAGYLTLSVREKWKNQFPKWLLSIWGSDIYYFAKDPGHLKKIKNVLKKVDYILCESDRDRKLAIKYGGTSEKAEVIPVAGGFDLDQINKIKRVMPSKRKVIVLKGYQGWSGDALTGLLALERCVQNLQEYKVIIHSTDVDSEVGEAAVQFSKRCGIPVEIVPSGVMHIKILKLYSIARCSINISLTDGVAYSLLESMATGAFPIQSNRSAASEWIGNGRTGMLIDPKNLEELVRKITIALKDDALVDKAALINAKVIAQRMDGEKIKKSAIKIYKKVMVW